MADLEPELVAALRERLAAETRLALEQARGVKLVLVSPPAPLRRPRPAPAQRGDRRRAGGLRRRARAGRGRVPQHRAALHRRGRRGGRARAAFDPRFYYRAKAPYQPRYWDELARRILLATRGAGRYLYKVLALDCDNTLWGGIVGEDAAQGDRLDPDHYPGNVYYRVQLELAALQRRGVLLCLCTKNNPDDVDEVLQRHPHMVMQATST